MVRTNKNKINRWRRCQMWLKKEILGKLYSLNPIHMLLRFIIAPIIYMTIFQVYLLIQKNKRNARIKNRKLNR